MDRKYAYPLRLRLMAPVIDTREEPYRSLLSAAAEEFNARSERAVNPKAIRGLWPVENGQISLVLSSSVALEHPGKALRLFSQILAENDAFAPAILHGRLLQTIATVDTPEVYAGRSPGQVSDEELLHTIVHAVLHISEGTSGDYKRRREVLTQMKAVALSAGLIDPDPPEKREEKAEL